LSIKRDLNCSGFNFQPVSVFILELLFHEIATGRKRAFCNVIDAFPFFLPKKNMLCNKHPMTQTGEMLLFGFKQKLKRKMKPENLNLKYNLSISGITQARRGEMICSVSLQNRDFKAERKYVSAILSVCSPFLTLSYSKVFFLSYSDVRLTLIFYLRSTAGYN
jgi:hypothetical protein